ncbi:hypothetical protein AVEN_114413-1 [Araneus ventricosus]|uniref:Tc1-like transposase DDE domain-containing protein n=1 Tax=Araneus ventricosus TaxID=182803 RepID=A0A4Y2T3W0_ARAVE|nr:hypothetical protein AVEN_188353-1 [Araneus ventricosus]GBN94124.1 hypothetical protein AVEN_114413-1 [Araneus ventricosus]
MGRGLFQLSDIPRVTQGQKQSKTYQETLASHLVPFVDIFCRTNLTFQHDNPSTHASKSTSQWLTSSMKSVLSVLAINPDLNFIGSVQGKFSNLVYGNSKQYFSVEVLKLDIEDVWFKLQP